MADAPERLRAGYDDNWPCPDFVLYDNNMEGGTEYIRADLVDELVKASEEVWRLSLVIESAVRNADPGNRPDVLAALKQTKAALTRIKGDGK